MGVDSAWHEGRRVTDEASLEVAVAVLGGLVNTELVAALAGLGVQAVGLTGADGGLVAVSAPALSEGATVVTGVATATGSSASGPAAAGSPLVPTPPRRNRR